MAWIYQASNSNKVRIRNSKVVMACRKWYVDVPVEDDIYEYFRQKLQQGTKINILNN